MSTPISPNDESAIGRFFRQLQEKLHFLFGNIQRDFQNIPPGFAKIFLKNGQLLSVFLFIIITIMILLFAIFYRIDKSKLSRIELPYNIETISYQALDFTHPKYKGKYQYFPILILVSILLFVVSSVTILSMTKFDDVTVKGFYFMMAIICIIPAIIFIILYANISKYLKPRNAAKEKINALFYKYMIDDLSAKSQLSIIPDGGRYSVYPMLKALERIAEQIQTESTGKKQDELDDIKQQKLTKAIVTFTLYKYYTQKSMEDYLLERALADSFSKYAIKGVDYCKYLPSNLRSLITIDISKVILYDRDLSTVFRSDIVNKARKNASMILREINGLLDQFIVNEDIVKKFIMTQTIIWLIFMILIGIVIMSVMNYRSKTI